MSRRPVAVTLAGLVDRIEAQAGEIATLRGVVHVQFARIAQIQAELDARSHRRHRPSLTALLALPVSSNGHGTTKL